jgi:ribulose-phosphate 3-epimerase
MDIRQSAIILRPSISSADQLHIADAIDALGSWPFLHIDIEDGVFVPNITFGLNTICQIAKYSKQELDVHLLTVEPLRYIPTLASFGIKNVAVHLESMSYPLEALQAIHSLGMKAGIALNFKTTPDSVAPFLDRLDYLLIMTAEPDGWGQQYSPAILPKLRIASAMLKEGQTLWADGGINRQNIGDIIRMGVNNLIVGRVVFSEGIAENNLRDLEIKVHCNTE